MPSAIVVVVVVNSSFLSADMSNEKTKKSKAQVDILLFHDIDGTIFASFFPTAKARLVWHVWYSPVVQDEHEGCVPTTSSEPKGLPYRWLLIDSKSILYPVSLSAADSRRRERRRRQ